MTTTAPRWAEHLVRGCVDLARQRLEPPTVVKLSREAYRALIRWIESTSPPGAIPKEGWDGYTWDGLRIERHDKLPNDRHCVVE